MAASTPEPAPARLRLHAININDVRDLIGADADTRAWAEAECAGLLTESAPPTTSRGFLARLFGRGRMRGADPGAAGTQPDSPPISPPTPPPDPPTGVDLATVLAGRHAAPERAGACWRVLEHLVARRAWASHEVCLDAREVADFDFALTLAGVPAEAGLGRILRSPAMLGLAPAPSVTVGYLPFAVVRLHAALYAAADVEDPRQAELARGLAEFWAKLPDWAEEAAAAGRGAPDLIAFHWTSGS